jgi:Tfp pilus assembly protein PilF
MHFAVVISYAKGDLSKADKSRIRASYYLGTGNDSAKQEIVKLMKSEPNNYQNLLLEGVYYAQKNPGLAKADFQKAVKLCNCSEALNCLAISYASSGPGKHDSVILVLKQSLVKTPNQPAVYATIGNYYFYDALEDTTLIDSAGLYDNKAYWLDTTNIPILRQYTYFLKSFYPCSDLTLDYFNRLAQLDPEDVFANLYIGSCLLGNEYFKKALPYIIKAQQSNPKSSDYNFTLANCYARIYDYCSSNDFLKKAISFATNDSILNTYYTLLVSNSSKCEPYDSLYKYLEVGSARKLDSIVQMKSIVDAANVAVAAFRDNQGEIDSLTKLAELNYDAKNYKQAAVCIDAMLAKGVIDDDVYMQRITLYTEMGQLTPALDLINAKLKGGQNYYLLFLSAVINTQLKQFEPALKIFTKMKADQTLPELNVEINSYLTYIRNNAELFSGKN